jgi:4-aminobutyrate aminotransferase-like enzyme
MLGVELVKDRATKAPAKDETLRVFEQAKDLGLLIGKGGFYGNVLRIKPPMCLRWRTRISSSRCWMCALLAYEHKTRSQ